MSARTAALLLAALACSRGPARPAALDTRHESCAYCRMAVSDAHFAAQLVAPGEEPRFFDDIGCLREWLRREPRSPSGAAAFVADHRTAQWVLARAAVYTRNDALETPMGSHLLAHVDAASRDADPAAAGRRPLAPSDVFGAPLPPGGAP